MLRFACDVSCCQDPPRHIVRNLEEFLTKGGVQKLKDMIDAARTECVRLATEAKAKPKAKKSKDPAEATSPKPKQAKQAQKDARHALVKLSQQLVLDMVKAVEEQGLLKQAMTLPTTSRVKTGSGCEVVTWLHVNFASRRYR